MQTMKKFKVLGERPTQFHIESVVRDRWLVTWTVAQPKVDEWACRWLGRRRGAAVVPCHDSDRNVVVAAVCFCTSLGSIKLPSSSVAFSPGIKQPGRTPYHSPPCSAEVKTEWSYTSALPVCLGTVVLAANRATMEVTYLICQVQQT
jgi:hypothetical protein